MTIETIVFLGGYARSGKTTALSYFKSQGIPTFSTSDILHQQASTMFEMLSSNAKRYPGTKGLSQDKGAEVTINVKTGCGSTSLEIAPSMRDILIAVAESTRTLDPNFYVQQVVKQVRCCKEGKLAIVETVGGSEFEALIGTLEADYTSYYLNIRREGELKGVDIRKLLPYASEIWNDGTIEELESQLNTQVIQSILK